jgi:hypothetical protein
MALFSKDDEASRDGISQNEETEIAILDIGEKEGMNLLMSFR